MKKSLISIIALAIPVIVTGVSLGTAQTQSGQARPVYTQPAQPQPGQPRVIYPQSGRPQPGQPQIVYPQSGQSQPGQPQIVYPQSGRPPSGQPRPVYPQTGQPQVVHPQPVQTPSTSENADTPVIIYGKLDCPSTMAARKIHPGHVFLDLAKEPKRLDDVEALTNGERVWPVIIKNQHIIIGWDGGICGEEAK